MGQIDTISAIVLNIFVLSWFLHVASREIMATLRDSENGKYVYWDYLHSREHLLIILVLIFLACMLFVLSYNRVCLSYIFFLIVCRTFIIPHYKKEREDGFSTKCVQKKTKKKTPIL